MQIISEPRKDIAKVWGTPAPKDTKYRLLLYHIQEDCAEGSLLLNTVTGELVLLDTDEAELVRELPASHTLKMDELIAHRFLVPEGFDDAKSVNQLRQVLRRLNSSKDIRSYSILPTSACNARCFYCYESSYPKYSMTSEIADKVVEYIVVNCGEKKRVSIQWFGGEPTLGEERIDQICDGLAKNKIEFSSSTISNGYLFTKDLARKAKEKWKLQSAQISMDGTEDVYNKAKAYENVKGSPYQRVMENIGHLLDEGIHVTVRMNLDFHNADDLRLLIDDLAGRFANRKSFSAYVQEITEDMGYSPVNHSNEERQKLIAKKIELNRYLEGLGCRKHKTLAAHRSLPHLRVIYCMADNQNSLLVNPLGQFGKCDHYSFARFVGDVMNGHDFDSPDAVTWLNPDYTNWCKNCSLFPICGQPENCIGKKECYSEEIQDRVFSIKRELRDMLETKNGRQRKENEETGI